MPKRRRRQSLYRIHFDLALALMAYEYWRRVHPRLISTPSMFLCALTGMELPINGSMNVGLDFFSRRIEGFEEGLCTFSWRTVGAESFIQLLDICLQLTLHPLVDVARLSSSQQPMYRFWLSGGWVLVHHEWIHCKERYRELPLPHPVWGLSIFGHVYIWTSLHLKRCCPAGQQWS